MRVLEKLLPKPTENKSVSEGDWKGEKVKAPFPYFGGKSPIAHIVWSYLGDVNIVRYFEVKIENIK